MKQRLIRTLKAASTVAVLAALGWGGYTLARYVRNDPRFEVRALSVTGVSGPLKRLSEEQVVAQAEFEVGTNVFRVDLEDIRQRVERLRWVRYAVVHRVLPDQIMVKIVEREPIGLARIRGEIYQFDEDAVILDLDPISTASFPILDGLRRNDPEGNLAKVGLYMKVLEELGETQLSEVHIEGVDVAVVSASDPLVVTLGPDDFRKRWIKFLQFKTQIHDQYPLAVRVDLRFKNQVIVRMKDDDDSGGQVLWDGAKKSL
jgi:cell division septal protein FtsQ